MGNAASMNGVKRKSNEKGKKRKRRLGLTERSDNMSASPWNGTSRGGGGGGPRPIWKLNPMDKGRK